MSEIIAVVNIKDLVVVRVKCNNARCGMTFEMPLEKLSATFGSVSGECVCPLCNADLHAPDDVGGRFNPFPALARAMRGLQKIEEMASVEFVVPERRGG